MNHYAAFTAAALRGGFYTYTAAGTFTGCAVSPSVSVRFAPADVRAAIVADAKARRTAEAKAKRAADRKRGMP